MNYKITTDFSKVKKEKCECVEFDLVDSCGICSGTGKKPIKITYKAGECDECEGKGKRFYPIDKVRGDCRTCNGTGKLHPKFGEVFERCECGHFKLEHPNGECILRICHCKKYNSIKRKFLSINKEKEEGMAVEI